jgi:predicted DNA-binding protein
VIFAVWCQIDTINLMAMTLRLDAETDRRLTEYAHSLGIPKSQAAIEAIQQLLDSQSSEAVTSRIFDKVLERDAELLKRLSDA